MAWDFPLTLPDREFDGFIFDCDGTLIDSMPLHWHAWRDALERHRAPFEFTLEMHHRFAGMSIPEIVRACNAQYGSALDSSSVERARMEFFFAHLDELVVVDPVVNFARAQLGKKPMAVASGSDRVIVERELAHLGLLEMFPVVVTASDVPRSKPHPDMFLQAAEKLGVRPEGCLVFEDGQNGLEAASRAGMASVYIPTND